MHSFKQAGTPLASGMWCISASFDSSIYLFVCLFEGCVCAGMGVKPHGYRQHKHISCIIGYLENNLYESLLSELWSGLVQMP